MVFIYLALRPWLYGNVGMYHFQVNKFCYKYSMSAFHDTWDTAKTCKVVVPKYGTPIKIVVHTCVLFWQYTVFVVVFCFTNNPLERIDKFLQIHFIKE